MDEMKIIEESKKYGYRVGLSEDGRIKTLRSPYHNYVFDTTNGMMLSWGRTQSEDPGRCPVPNILDMEISTICHHGCSFCYKSNLPEGKNMSFDTFRKIFDVQSRGLTQIAFGSGYLGTENPEIFRMMDYAREHGVIPNITVGYVSDESADLFASRVGAIAISCYESLDRCYDSVKRMTDRGVDQTNIHFMICEETYDRCMRVLKDITVDPRLEKLNAIVMLSLKTKGRAVENGFHPLSQEKFDSICQYAMEHNIGLGFDSCSSLKASRAFGGKFRESIIPCESGLESSYINVDGQYFPCSFSEGLRTEEVDWTSGINVLECHTVEEFLDRVWNGKRTLDSMRLLEGTCSSNECNVRTCPFYNV